MSIYVNLMTRRAKVRQLLRDRMRLWSRVVAAVIVGLVLHSLVTWWPVRSQSQRVELLETQYEPLREMKLDVGRLSRELIATRTNYRDELVLADTTPVLSLLGVVSRAIEQSDGQLFLEDIHYEQTNSALSGGQLQEQLSLEGISADTLAVQALVERLREALPFATVELRNTEAIEVNRHPMQAFFLDCTF